MEGNLRSAYYQRSLDMKAHGYTGGAIEHGLAMRQGYRPRRAEEGEQTGIAKLVPGMEELLDVLEFL